MFQKIIFFCLFSQLFSHCSAEFVSLDGTDWTAYNPNKTIHVSAKVPGSIYSDLRRGGVLKDDLYRGNNDVDYRWVSYEDWTFEKNFHVGSSVLSKERVNLLAYGLDTIATIYVNNELIGKTDNQFVRYVFDVKPHLRPDNNTIRVEFQSAPVYAKQKSQEYYDKYGYKVLPDGLLPDKMHPEHHYNFIRKMASSFAWDWGPAFPTQGIWKSIGIEAYNTALLRDMTVETAVRPLNHSEWVLVLRAQLESVPNTTFEAIVDIFLGEDQLITKNKITLVPRNGIIGLQYTIPITFPIVRWFPNGVADNTQKLYRLNVSLSFPDSSETTALSQRIGFRTIELVQEPVKPEGLTFYFKVNDIPFYAKGSNWIPAHVLQEDITPQYLRHLLGSAKRANMNMMRVWGGGVYESDLFYELADEMGIMIWQDLMFACSFYPTDPHFLESTELEVKQQVRRLQHHPSIAIWSGNNENELFLMISKLNILPMLPYDKHYQGDYVKLYVDTLEPRVLIEDPTRPFVTSSPSNGLESVTKENYTAANPNDDRYGDVHHYDDLVDQWDYRTKPSAKFTSEFGFQSFPSVETLSRPLDEKDLTYPISDALEHRQHHDTLDLTGNLTAVSGTTAIEKQIARHMKLPSKGGVDRLSDFVYLSQVSQAMAIKTEIEFYRRNRAVDPKTGEGNSMGALYWQLNDIWEAPSWASIEFGGKWKVLHSYAKSFFDNHLVVPYEDMDETLRFAFVRDDYLGHLAFTYNISFYKWSKAGTPVHQLVGAVATDSFSATVIYSDKVSDLLTKSKECKDRTVCVIRVEVINEEHKIRAENFFLLAEPKNSKLIDPKIKVIDVKRRPTLTDGRHVFDVRLSVEAVAPFVVLDFALESGISGQFPENGFFIFDTQKSITFETESDVNEEKIKDKIVIKTLTDIK